MLRVMVIPQDYCVFFFSFLPLVVLVLGFDRWIPFRSGANTAPSPVGCLRKAVITYKTKICAVAAKEKRKQE